MVMFRRSRKPAPPLHRKQQEIAQQEAQLRQKVESLKRIVTQNRPAAQKKSSAQIAQRMPEGVPIEKRFHVSIAMESPQVFDTGSRRRPRALRKQRREGQMVFLILLVALAVAVLWLISHLHP